MTATPSRAASPVEFFFDLSSPYSYVASEWIEALAARHGRTVRWHAMLLGVTFAAAELKSPVSHPIKREYSMLDFDRSARFAGVPLTMPEKFPIPTQNAARVFWWLSDEAGDGGAERAAAWARHCFRAYFTRGVDLSDRAALRVLAIDFGLDGDAVDAVGADPKWKARLKVACDDAVARGVFGAPFFIVDGEPFWGNDRRAQIERWLESGPY